MGLNEFSFGSERIGLAINLPLLNPGAHLPWVKQVKVYPFINTLLSIKNTTSMHTLPWATDSDGYFLWYLVY